MSDLQIRYVGDSRKYSGIRCATVVGTRDHESVFTMAASNQGGSALVVGNIEHPAVRSVWLASSS
jgi:hypothetical protein